MDYFYDAQFKNVLSQFTRIFSNFKYMTGINHTGQQEVISVPCRVGSISRMAGAISRKNSENVALSAPFIQCWIQQISVARNRTMNPTHVNSLVVNERHYDYQTNKYNENLGNQYQVDRLVPVPYDITMQVDIWSTNEEMKLQILEQILVLFNPSIDFQKNENPFDWQALMMVELESINYSSRSVPIGDDTAMEITTLTFKVENFFLNPPAKVKKQKIINKIINDFDGAIFQTWEDTFVPQITTNYKNQRLTVDANEVTISQYAGNVQWSELFINNNIQFVKDGVLKLKLNPNYGFDFISAPIILDILDMSTTDPQKLLVEVNKNTLPPSTVLAVDAVIDPNTLYPYNNIQPSTRLNPQQEIGKRYLILNDIIQGTEAWGALSARAGQIITTNDGINYFVDFNQNSDTLGQVVKNLDDNELYVRITNEVWVNVYQGTYNPEYWQLVQITENNIGV